MSATRYLPQLIPSPMMVQRFHSSTPTKHQRVMVLNEGFANGCVQGSKEEADYKLPNRSLRPAPVPTQPCYPLQCNEGLQISP